MTRFQHLSPAVLIVVVVCVQACQRPTPSNSNPSHQQQTSPNIFDAYFESEIPPADGFDFPVGDANASGPYKDIATGIGFHGWISEWDNSGPRHLSWGCVVMHLNDIQKLYDQVPEGTMVVIR